MSGLSKKKARAFTNAVFSHIPRTRIERFLDKALGWMPDWAILSLGVVISGILKLIGGVSLIIIALYIYEHYK